jgi:hypothetical protein
MSRDGAPPPVQSSLRSHELFLVTTAAGDPGIFEHIKTVVRQAAANIAEEMRRRCPHTRAFYQVDPDKVAGCQLALAPWKTALDEELAARRALHESSPSVVTRAMARGAERRQEQFPTYDHIQRLRARRSNLGCPEKLEQFGKESYGIAFGTLDFVFQLPFHHPIWSVDFQRELVRLDERKAISAIVSMPLYRITKERKKKTVAERGKLMALAFVSLPPDLRGLRSHPATRTRASHLRKLDGLLHDCDVLSDPATEMFLSLSTTFPIVLRTKVKDFGELDRFLAAVRRRTDALTGTCTVLALTDSLQDTGEGLPRMELPEPQRFRLLLRLRGDESAALRQVMAKLNDAAITPVPHRTPPRGLFDYFLGEPHYWDWTAEIHSLEPFHLMETVAHRLCVLDGVEQTTVIPMLTGRPLDLEEEDRGTAARDLARYLEKRRGRIDEEPIEFHDSFREAPERMPYQLMHDAPVLDPLNVRLYDLRFQHVWLASRVQKLQRHWFNHTPSFTRQPSRHPSTFGKILGKLDRQIRILDRLRELASELRGEIESAAIAEGEGRNEQAEARRAAVMKRIRQIWEKLLFTKQELDVLLGVVNAISHTYSERSLSWQIASIASPTLTIGEETGITYMNVETAARVFRHYCSTLRKTYRDQLEVRPSWSGIVTTRGGEDYALFPELAVLRLPVDFKIHAQARLLPIAHEAAHQVLFDLHNLAWDDETRDAFSEYGYLLSTTRRVLYRAAIADLEASGPFPALEDPLTGEQDDVAQAKDRVIASLREAIEDSGTSKERIWLDEFVTDILAGLCAGPAFFTTLSWLGFDHRQRASEKTHPPIWVRLMLGHVMARLLAWTRGPGDPSSDPWGLHRNAPEALRYHLHLDRELDLDHPEPFMYREPSFHLLRVFARTPEGLNRVERWMAEYSRDFLFFPRPSGECTREERRAVVAATTDYCKEIAERIVFGRELILDAPLKYITAASELPSVGRPAHPAGRVLLSLHYSEARIDSFLETIKNATGLDRERFYFGSADAPGDREPG